jgi:hypothetical protein
VAEFQVENVPGLEGIAYALLARSLSEQGKSEEAQKAARSAISYSAGSGEPMIRISVAITVARVRNASDPEAASRKQRAPQVIHDLQALITQAKKSGFLGLEFEARLAEGEVKMDSGQTTTGLAELASLAQQAQTKGFGLIARKAGAAHQ